MQTLTLGVYVIGVADGQARNAFTAASVMQVSFDPVLIALSIGYDHASYPLLHLGRCFTVNVLKADQLELARHFGTSSGTSVDKLHAVRWRSAPSGAPILEDALAYLDCELHSTLPAGDHELIVARVRAAEVLSRAAPLSYAATGDMDGASKLYRQ